MNLKEEVQLLREIPLFSGIDPSKLKFLAFTSETMRFAEGHDLFRQGDIGDAAYIIVSGEVDVLIDGPEGETPIARLGKYDLVGEIAIIIDVPRTATVRAVTELETLVISKGQFSRILSQFPEIAIELLRELAFRLERTTAKLAKVNKEH